MTAAALPSNEAERLRALHRYGILDTPAEQAFDDVTRLIAEVCEAPVAVVNLIAEGRQWFKSEIGLGIRETALDVSFCAHAILQPGLFVIPDTLDDPRFADNPLVAGAPGLRFYAGALLETPDGHPLGTLCVLDYKPRRLTPRQEHLLRIMARQVMSLLELRRAVAAQAEALHERQRAEEALARMLAEREDLLRQKETLLREVNHRVTNSLQLVSSLLHLQGRAAADPHLRRQLDQAADRVSAVAAVHRRLQGADRGQTVRFAEYLRELCAGLESAASDGTRRGRVEVEADERELPTDIVIPLALVLNEVVTNAFKHAAGADRLVRVRFRDSGDGRLTVDIGDDGPGLPDGFDFERSPGLGMRLVRALSRQLGAELEIGRDPQLGGARFRLAFAAPGAQPAA